MSVNNLVIQMRTMKEGINVIAVQGILTSEGEERLMAAYQQAASVSPAMVIFDFTEMEYINSSGIGLLITTLIRARRQGNRLAGYGLKEHFRQIFSLTRLDEAMPIFDTDTAALEALQAESQAATK